MSDGLFDPTVQPLWECLKSHFSKPNPDPSGPSREEWNKALAQVGFGHVLFDASRIAFARPAMALTLNGIAQGFVTDRVTALLKAGGVKHALVDMGEYRAIGTGPDGRPWRIGIADLEAGSSPEEFIDIEDRGLATSSFEGFQFEESGRFNHLLNPKTGYSASLYERVTVVAPSTAMADALATAFSLMGPKQIASSLKNGPEFQPISNIGTARTFICRPERWSGPADLPSFPDCQARPDGQVVQSPPIATTGVRLAPHHADGPHRVRRAKTRHAYSCRARLHIKGHLWNERHADASAHHLDEGGKRTPSMNSRGGAAAILQNDSA